MSSRELVCEGCPKSYAMFANTTLSSSPDEYGCRYWSSFDMTSFAKGNRLKAYEGLLNGEGPRRGDHTVIKIFRDHSGTEDMCNAEIHKSRKAQSFVEPFKEVVSMKMKIHFASLLKACMDDVCLMKNALSSGRKLSKTEWVLIEEKVGKNLTHFISNIGRASEGPGTQILNAFVHFTYHQSGGKLVVCDLEGSTEGMRICLKTPTIHSVGKEYGKRDSGEQGINKVFSHHVCNDFCKNLITPRRAEPSAPYDPEMSPVEFDWSRYPLYEQFSPFSFGQYFTFPPCPPNQLYPDIRQVCALNQHTPRYQSTYKHPISA